MHAFLTKACSARHKESKWAKLGKKAGRAVWDEEFRTSLTEMASRKDELRRRIDGETAGPRGDDGSESDDDSDMGEEQEKARLLDQLEKAAAYDDDEPESKLMQMKFMQRGEGLRKRENDDLVAQLRRDLQGEGAESSDDLGESRGDVGRRHFGALKSAAAPSTVQGAKAGLGGKQSDGKGAQSSGNSAQTLLASGPSNTQSSGTEPASGGGAWSSQGPRESRSRSKHHNSMKAAELDLSVAMPETKYSAAKKTTVAGTVEDAGDEDELHLPMAVRDQELLKRAFAGADVVGEFLQEKKKAVAEDDEKEVDETLPGWGSWVGDGVSTRELGRHKGRFITKVAGTQRKDRKDFKLERVIVNEKRVKKNQAYRATQLPHPFETRQQYESSLRLPIGQEWMTKETFQESTKPRVIVKQGIITPMSKPMC